MNKLQAIVLPASASVGSYLTGLILKTMPFMQWCAYAFSIGAAAVAILTYAEKKGLFKWKK